MSIRRRDFLSSFGAASFAAALPLTKGEANVLASPPVADSPWDVTWVDRIKGKYRAVFDSPGFSDGAALFRSVIWARQYKDVYGATPAEMSTVLVIRHTGIVLAMNDEFWQTYEIGKRKKLKDSSTKKFFAHNPIASSPKGAPPQFADMTIPKFIENGGIVLACNMAFMDPVSIVEKQEKLKHEEAEKKARAFLLPGVILQPSGIFAVLRAQEAGCNYILGS
jgi:hypothetical protein